MVHNLPCSFPVDPTGTKYNNLGLFKISFQYVLARRSESPDFDQVGSKPEAFKQLPIHIGAIRHYHESIDRFHINSTEFFVYLCIQCICIYKVTRTVQSLLAHNYHLSTNLTQNQRRATTERNISISKKINQFTSSDVQTYQDYQILAKSG